MRISRGLALAGACILLLVTATGAAGEEMASQSLEMLAGGSEGEAVVLLQERLTELGYSPGAVDGIYGSGTKHAVRLFQKQNQLEADGIAGPETLAVLYSDTALPAPETARPVNVLAGDLPMLVNKEHPVTEEFAPADLITLNDYCDSSLVKIKYKHIQAVQTAADALIAMLEAARSEGLTKWQISAAYRSFEEQVSILESKISSYLSRNSGWSRTKARNAALRTVAEPGCSEHHLGLAIDINVPGASNFAGTKQCRWLHSHCWEYGFILRYPKGKEKITGFEAEAWHIRYVGVEHALYMRDHDLCLEEYLAGIEDGEISRPVTEIVEDVTLEDE